MERIQEEKEELNAKTIKIAKNEATEAKVLMKYFENRMKDSESNYKTCDANYKEAQEALKRMEAQLAAADSSMVQLKKALETSERQRMKLIQDAEKSLVEGANPEASSGTRKTKATRKQSMAGSSHKATARASKSAGKAPAKKADSKESKSKKPTRGK